MRTHTGKGLPPVLLLSLLAGMLAGSRPAGAQKPIVLTAPRGAAATFDPANNYQPTNVSFAVAGQVLSVGIATVDFFPAGTASPARYEIRQLPPTHIAIVTAALPDGRESVLQTAMTDGKPMATFSALGPGANGGSVVLFLAGVDRTLHANGGTWAAAVLEPGRKLSVPASAVVFQDRDRQHGLILRVAKAPGLQVKLTGGRTGIWVHVPAAGGEQARRFTVAGFIGDALIALDDASVRDVAAAVQSEAPAPVVVTRPPAWPAAPPAVAPAPGRPRRRPPAQLASVQPAPSEPPTSPAPPQMQERFVEGWDFWTGTHRAFAPLLADQREAQVAVGLKYKSGNPHLDANIGGDLVVAEYAWAQAERLTFSARGLYTMRLDWGQQDSPVLNSDYYGGGAIGYQRGRNAFELYIFHESSHLGDKLITSGQRQRIGYSREAVRFLWSHDLRPDLRIYVGPTFNLTGNPDAIAQALMLQAGVEYRFRLFEQDFYAALDLQSRQQNDFGLNVAGQIGLELGDPGRGRHRPRVFLELFNGYSNMGQYWDERESTVSVGLGYNF